MEPIIYKLKFKSSIHLGEREQLREGTDIIIHSDTLFSAICHCYLLLYGEEKLNSLLQQFSDEPPFLISSAFPFWKNKLYFPIPYNQLPKEKKLKKILFIEKDGFEKLLNGESIDKIAKKFKTIPDLIPTNDEERLPYRTVDTPRTGLSRLTSQPGERFFYFGEVYYSEDAGLFFLVDFKKDAVRKEFESTLNLMKDEGIGGDRTSGKGHFELSEIESLKFNLPASQAIVTLSLYHPKENELPDIGEGYYEIIERKGYVYSPYIQSLRRKSVRMFKEGSVFKSIKKGTIADVTPEGFNIHKIYRYGLCLGFPCELEIKNED